MVHLYFFPYIGLPGHYLYDTRILDEYEAVHIAPQKKSIEMAIKNATNIDLLTLNYYIQIILQRESDNFA